MRYKVAWDEEDPHYFKTKKEAVRHLEMCAGVYIEKIDEKRNRRRR